MGRRPDWRLPAARGSAGARLGAFRGPPWSQDRGHESPRCLRGDPGPVGRGDGSRTAAAAPDRHRPLRGHRPAGARDGDRPGSTRGHRARGGPDPGRADPVGRGRPSGRRPPGRYDRDPAHVPADCRAVRARARARARVLRRAWPRRGPHGCCERVLRRRHGRAWRRRAPGRAVPRQLHRPLLHADPAACT